MSPHLLTNKDFELEEVPYHVDPLFPKDVTLFIGNQGGAKSLTSLFLGVCTSAGRDFLGFATKTGPVALVNNEHGKEGFHDRWIDKYCIGLGLVRSQLPLYSFHYQYQDLTDKDDIQTLLSMCKELSICLLIIDNVGASIGNQNENYTHVIQKLFRSLEEFVKIGITPIAIHHYNKDGKVRGSSVFEKQADRLFAFKPVSTRTRQMRNYNGELLWVDSDTPMMETVLQDFCISSVKSRQGAPKPFLVRIEEDDITGATRLVYRGQYEEQSPYQELKDRIMWFFNLNMGMGFSEKEIHEGVACGDIRDIREAISELRKEEKIEYRAYGKRIRIFEIGAEEKEFIVKGFEEELKEAVLEICQESKNQGRTDLIVADDLVKPLLKKVPALSKLTSPDDEKLIGPSKRVASLLKKLGFIVILKSDGSHLLL